MTNTSTIVVALPAEDDPVQKIGPEQKHATLLFFGEVSDAEAKTVHDAVRGVLRSAQPFDQDAGRVQGLGDDEPQAVVLKLVNDGPDLEYTLDDLRERLLEQPGVRELWSRVEQYPTFTPHVTLGYGDEVSDDDRDAASRLPSVRFDRLAVWHRDDQTEYPLGRTVLETVTAGVRFVRTAEGARRFKVPVGSKIEVSDGRVVKILDRGSGGAVTGTQHSASAMTEPVDPDRTPTKFVATVPGQKAKLAPGSAAATGAKGTDGPEAEGAQMSASSSRQRAARLAMMRARARGRRR